VKKWQKYWLYLLIFYSSLHLLRDIFQDLGIKNFLSTVLVKKSADPIVSYILWTSLNTYVIAIAEIVLAIICLKRNSFSRLGNLTILLALITVGAWLAYWFFL